MSRQATEVDFLHGPPSLEPSSTPWSLHDGMVEAIAVDARACTVSLRIDVDYLRRFGGLADDVRFGIEISGVRQMRAKRWRFPPDPFEVREGEPSPEHNARVKAWLARGQTVSWDWDEAVRAIAARGMDVQSGALLSTDDRAAIRLSGQVGDDEAWTRSTWVTIEIAGSAIRWTRSDGAPWSAEALDTLSDGYWEAFAERGEQLKRSQAYLHVQPMRASTMAQLSVELLRGHLARLDALPESHAVSGIDPSVLATLAPWLHFVRDDARWRAERDEVLAELARRGAGER